MNQTSTLACIFLSAVSLLSVPPIFASEAISNDLSVEDQMMAERLYSEYATVQTTGMVSRDTVLLLLEQACQSIETPGIESLMRVTARRWKDSDIDPAMTASYVDCLLVDIQEQTDRGPMALEVLAQIPGEPGLAAALSLIRNDESPLELRRKAVSTFALRTTPLPQDDLVRLLVETDDEGLFNTAAYALRRSNDPEIIPVLVENVNRFWNPAVRLTLENRIDLVREAAAYGSPAAREAAFYALDRLNVPFNVGIGGGK